MRSSLFTALVIVAMASSPVAWAQDDDEPLDPAVAAAIAKANAECFTCHSAAGLRQPPRAGLDLIKLIDSTVEPAVYHASNHGDESCVDCHGGEDDEGKPRTYYAAYPHDAAGKDSTADCADCHAAKVKRLKPQFNDSVHAKAPELKAKFSCATCHDPHTHAVAEKLVDPHLVVAQDNRVCRDCHDAEVRFAEFAPPEADAAEGRKVRPKIDQIHDWLPNTELHWSAVRCIDCHTPQVAENKLLSHEILDEDKAEKNCASCHSRDSSLNLRLYRHLAAGEQDRLGFTNAVVLRTSYVIGATRHPLLELLVGLALAGALGGVLLHGLARFIAARRRKQAEPSETEP